MNKTPQLENGYTKIADEILEALCRTNLSPYESRVLYCVFRKTYGFNKKEDWIALSQIVKMTGMQKSHVSRAKSKLITRNIVTQTGNKIAFNKLYTQWRELPKQVTYGKQQKLPIQVTKKLPKQVIKVTQTGNLELPKQGHTKETITKETIQKREPNLEKTKESIQSVENKFIDMSVNLEWCDMHYAEKVIRQGKALRGQFREEFERKLRLCVGQGKSKHHAPQNLAKKVYHELAGYVNDKGEMQRSLSAKEQGDRQKFAEEEYGKKYVEQELQGV